MGGQEDQRHRQEGKDLKADGVSPHHQGHWVLQGPAPESREVAQHIEQRPQPGLIPAQVEDQGQDDARVGVVRVQNVDGQHPEEEPPPLPLLHAVDGQQAEKQSDKDVPAGELFPEVVGMEGQDEEGLGDHCKERQPPQIPPDVPCVHQANCQAVAENREGQPSYPPEFRVLGEKDGPHVVHHHSQDGEQLQKVRVQVGPKLWRLSLCLCVHVRYSSICVLHRTGPGGSRPRAAGEKQKRRAGQAYTAREARASPCNTDAGVQQQNRPLQERPECRIISMRCGRMAVV